MRTTYDFLDMLKIALVVLVAVVCVWGHAPQASSPAAIPPVVNDTRIPEVVDVPSLPPIYEEIQPNYASPKWQAWDAKYAAVPLDQRVYFFVTRALRDMVVVQTRAIEQLQERVRVLESRVGTDMAVTSPVRVGPQMPEVKP